MYRKRILACLTTVLLSGCLADFAYDFGDGGNGHRDGATTDGATPDAALSDGAVTTDAAPSDGAVTTDAAPSDASLPDAQAPDARPDAAIPPSCGDGNQDSGEACDDGNNNNGDGCSADCQSDESCGNGIADTAVGEECDGSDLRGTTCLDLGINAPTASPTCTTGCDFATAACCPVWQDEVVGPIDDGSSAVYFGATAIALDDQGRPRVAFYDDTGQDLMYAHHDGSSWTVDTVDSAGNVGKSASLVLDGSQRPHIAYRSDDTGALKYAWKNGATWEIEEVDTGTNTGHDTSIQLDQAGLPHIAYRSWGDDAVKYAVHDGSIWSIDTVDDESWHPSLTLDGADVPHISYIRWWSTELTLRYATWGTADWVLEDVEVVGTGITFMPKGDSAIALNNGGLPRIAYQDVDTEDVRYASRSISGAWQTQLVLGTGAVGDSLSLVIDGANQSHISFRDDTENNLRYARWTGVIWDVQTPDPDTQIGHLSALALTGGSLAHISYLDFGGFQVKHAWLQACP